MFSMELKELLPQIITSWQVIVISIALVLYMWLVNYVARTYHRPRFISKSKPKRKKAEAAPPVEVDDHAELTE